MLWRDHNQVKTFALNNSNNVDHCYFLTNLTQYIFTDAHTHMYTLRDIMEFAYLLSDIFGSAFC